MSLDNLSRIHHLLSKDCAEDHLYILHKRVVPIVIAVQPHLIRIYHVVVIPHGQFLVAHLVNLLLCQRKTLNLEP